MLFEIKEANLEKKRMFYLDTLKSGKGPQS